MSKNADLVPSLPGLSLGDEGASVIETKPAALKTTAGFALALENPVAKIYLLGALPHLDRVFDYAVPEEYAEVTPGCLVKVKFAGKTSDGIVFERCAQPEAKAALAPILKVVSFEPVLTETLKQIAREVADEYGGTLGNILRLAIPNRHARAEKQVLRQLENAQLESATAVPHEEPSGDATGVMQHYQTLPAFVKHLPQAHEICPQAVLTLDFVDRWTQLFAEVLSKLPAEAGALVLVPDNRDVDLLSEKLGDYNIAHCTLRHSDGPERRFANFLRIKHGLDRIVVGTRSAAFAPVQNLSLTLIFDSGSDAYRLPNAPYPDLARVLEIRSQIEKTAYLSVGYALSLRDYRRCENKEAIYCHPLKQRGRLEMMPRLKLMDEALREREGASGYARIPAPALKMIREGLEKGTVLVQVPRSGYIPAVACSRCGTRATCANCHANVEIITRTGKLWCRTCGRQGHRTACEVCHASALRALVSGSGRTADDLQRAFPDANVVLSGAAKGVTATVEAAPGTLVIATPGAEPVCLPDANGYGYEAAVLLDGDLLLSRSAYDADIEAVRRWRNALALVKPAHLGGNALLVANENTAAVRSLIMPESLRFATEVAAARKALSQPPYGIMAQITGDYTQVDKFLQKLKLPGDAQVYGPTLQDQTRSSARAVIFTAATNGSELAKEIKAEFSLLIARKEHGNLSYDLNPEVLL